MFSNAVYKHNNLKQIVQSHLNLFLVCVPRSCTYRWDKKAKYIQKDILVSLAII